MWTNEMDLKSMCSNISIQMYPKRVCDLILNYYICMSSFWNKRGDWIEETAKNTSLLGLWKIF